jgi:ADP-ribosylation factor GTPase-activating protein 2/3
MGMNRLGFGQVGPAKAAAGASSAAAPKKLGFGAVGSAKAAAADGKLSLEFHYQWLVPSTD